MKVTTDACLFGAWVANELAYPHQKTKQLLDVGCGTGLLSLMVAQKNDVWIDALEIDAAAATQAYENFDASLWKERITVHHQDVIKWQPSKKYECIISNPPFYEQELKSATDTKNIAHHDKGLRLEDLLKFIAETLVDNGTFFLLLPYKRKFEIEVLFSRFHLHIVKLVSVKQTDRHSPFRLMIQGSKIASAKNESELIIKTGSEYTAEFISLLKDYYLYLS